jgi:hypothetical protein
MWFFKRKKGLPARAVIDNDCYATLPDTLKTRFYPAPDDAEATHKVMSSPDGDGEGSGEELILGAFVEGGLDLMLGSADTPTENYSIDDEPTVSSHPSLDDTGGDFGGGSGCGGGASDSY